MGNDVRCASQELCKSITFHQIMLKYIELIYVTNYCSGIMKVHYEKRDFLISLKS